MIIPNLMEQLEPYTTVDGGVEREIDVEQDTIDQAVKFLSMLSEDLPIPDAGIDPDEMIGLEWYNAPKKVLSISIDETGKIYYAALIEEEQYNGHGDISDELVKTITILIKKVMGV